MSAALCLALLWLPTVDGELPAPSPPLAEQPLPPKEPGAAPTAAADAPAEDSGGAQAGAAAAPGEDSGGAQTGAAEAAPAPQPDDGSLSPEEMRELEEAMKRDMQAGGFGGAGPKSGSKFVMGSSEAAPRPSQAAPAAIGLPSVANLNPNISFVGDFALAAFSNDKPLQAGGHDPHRNGFNLQQLELAVGAAVDPFMRADANIVFSQFGVEIEEAYATTTSMPFQLQMRMGQFLTRFGRINAQHLHSWDFMDSPFFWSKVFGPEGNRGVAAELSWLAPTPWYVELILSANEAAGGSTARSFLGNTSPWVQDPRMIQMNAMVRQFFPLGDSFSLATGLSAATGPHLTGRFEVLTLHDLVPDGSWGSRGVDEAGVGTVGPPLLNGRDHRAELVGADVYLKFRPIGAALPSYRLPLPGNPSWAPPFEVAYQIVSFTAEWIARRRQVAGGTLTDHGGYAQLFWRFASRGSVAARLEYGSGIRADYLGGDPVDPEWTTWRVRGTTAVTFWPSEFSRFRAQYSLDRPLWRNTPTHAFMLGMEFGIGAHGAHAF